MAEMRIDSPATEPSDHWDLQSTNLNLVEVLRDGLPLPFLLHDRADNPLGVVESYHLIGIDCHRIDGICAKEPLQSTPTMTFGHLMGKKHDFL